MSRPVLTFLNCLVWAALGLSGPRGLQAQTGTIGSVEYYGLEKVSRAGLDSALRLGPGDSIPARAVDQARVIQRLTSVRGVRAARLEPVCCENEGFVLYVGIEEVGAPGVTFALRPTGAVRMTDSLRALSDSFVSKMMEGIQAGQSGDDLTEGHSLLAYGPARQIQEVLLRYTAQHLDELRQVLRTSSDDESRAAAAWALGYAPDKGSVIPDLVAATRDPYDEVRNNAVRALAAIGTLAARRPELGLSVPAEPMLRLLRSPVWTDRNKASLALMMLTQGRDSALLGRLKREAAGPLVEMARWRTGHALAPYLVVARMAGVSDSAAFALYQQGKRESVLGHAHH